LGRTTGFSKHIVCLANSRKLGGRCVAGKELVADGFGGWIRPVSGREGGALDQAERCYANGAEPAIFDIIEIPLLAPDPSAHQTENHRIDAASYWHRLGVCSWDQVDELVDEPDSLWGEGESTQLGQFDRLAEYEAADYGASLWLIEPDSVTMRVLTLPASLGGQKRIVRAAFQYQGLQYDFKVTDPKAEVEYFRRADGDHRLDEGALFCVSLTEAFVDGYCYKLVATVITEHSGGWAS